MRLPVRLSVAGIFLIAVTTASLGVLAQNGQYHGIGTPEFEQVWERTDLPVQQGQTSRTWVWGPGANSPMLQEDYLEAPDGKRWVQYFDKSRMEMPWNGGDPDSPWYVTQGLLARELMTGQLQMGDDTFQQHSPSAHPAVGDPDGVTAPSYAVMGLLMAMEARAGGTTIMDVVDNAGQVSQNSDLAAHNVTDYYFVPETGHYVASVFWDLMNSTGTIYENGEFGTGSIFKNPFYAVGFPLTPAVWSWTKVGDVKQDVLIQCFERRCLTFTPDNDPDWQLEAGNVGQHYYHWRYSEIDREAAAVSFTVTPEDATNDVGDSHVLTVTAFDISGQPKSGVPVQAEVVDTTGTGELHLGKSMAGTTGANGDGIVELQYTGEETGTDTIRVSVAGVVTSQDVTKTWVDAADDDEDSDPLPAPDPGNPFTIELEHVDSDVNTVGDPHTVYATVEDLDGLAVADETGIQFTIDGPNNIESGVAVTENGVVTFTYTGTVTGVDSITASWNDVESNTIEKTWLPDAPAGLELEHDGIESNPPIPENVIYLEPHAVVGTVVDSYLNPVPGVEIDFAVTGDGNPGVGGTTSLPHETEINRAITNEEGQVRFSYVGTNPGTDTITGTVIENSDLSSSVEKIWLDLRISIEHDSGDSKHTGTSHGSLATVEVKEHESGTWNPLGGVLVQFAISGANQDVDPGDLDLITDPAVNGAFFGQTGNQGEVSFSYAGQNTGEDTLSATIMVDADTQTSITQSHTVDWYKWSLSLDNADGHSSLNHVDTEHVVVATVTDQEGDEVDGVEVSFGIIDGPHEGEFSHTGTTGDSATGQVTFSYTGAETGEDTTQAEISDSRAGGQVDPETISKTWAAVEISFDPVDAENPYFTSGEIESIEGLFNENFEGADESLADFWQEHTGHDSPNMHTVEIGVTLNDEPVADGEEVDVHVVHDPDGIDTAILNQSYTVSDGSVSVTYAATDAGLDVIHATYSVGSGSTSKTWTPFLEYDYQQQATYITLSVDPAEPTVDETVTLTAILLDQFGQPIPDISVTFESDQQTIPGSPVETNEHGQAVIDDHGNTEVGDELITITVNGVDPVSETISWAAGAPDRLALSLSTDTATVGDTVVLTALVQDQHDNPVPDINVQFSSDRQGDLGLEIPTDSGGQAVITEHTHQTAESEEISATISGLDPETETISWQAGAPATISLAHLDHEGEATPENAIYLQPHTVVATVYDEFENVVSDLAAVEFNVSPETQEPTGVWTHDPGDAPDDGSSGFTGQTSSDGQIAFTYTGTNPGQDTITASLVDDQSDTLDSDSVSKIWQDVRISLSPEDETGLRGSLHTVDAQLQIEVDTDDWQNLEFDDESITFDVAGANPAGSDTVDTNSQGLAQLTYTGSNLGTDTIAASIGGTTIGSNAVTMEWEIQVVLGPTSSENFVVEQHTVTATVTDHNGPVTGASVEFSFVDGSQNEGVIGFSHDPGDTGQALNVTNGDGQISFTYSYNPTGYNANDPGTDTLTATVTLSGLEFESGQATRTWLPVYLALQHGDDQTATNAAGDSHTIVATLVDALEDGDPIEVAGITVEFAFESESVHADVTGSTDPDVDGNNTGQTDANGQVSFTYTGTSVGTDILTASLVDWSTTSSSLTKTWVPGDPHEILLEHVGNSENGVSTNTVGENHSVTATVQDAHGNAVTGFEDPITFLLNGVEQEPAELVADGVATFTYSSTEAREDTIGVETDLESNSLTKIWVAGAPDKIVLTHTNDDPENTVNTSHSVTATVIDQYENTVVIFEDEINFFINEQAQTPVQADEGVVIFEYTGPEQTGVDTITAESVGLESNELTKTWVADEAFELKLSVDPDAQTVGEVALLTAVVKDEYGNPVPSVNVVFESDRESDPIDTVVTDGDGEAIVLGHSSDQVGDETITATVQGTTIDDSQIITWESGQASQIQMGDCGDQVFFSGSNGYCFISATVMDVAGNELDNVEVRFRVDDDSWEGSSGHPIYTLRDYDDGSTVGSGSDEQQKMVLSNDQGTAFVTHRARNPEPNRQITIHAEVLDPDDSNIILASSQLIFTWGGSDSEDSTFTVSVSEDVEDWTSVGLLSDDPDVIGRYAQIEVEVLDGDNIPMADELVTFSHDAGSGTSGNFSGDPENPHTQFGDGVNPLSNVETDEDGKALAVFFVPDGEELPVTASIEVTVVGIAGEQQGSVRFIEFPEPNSPTSLSASADGHDAIELTWTASAHQGGPVGYYLIERSGSESGPWTEVGQTGDGNTTEYIDTGLSPGTTYYYRVIAVNSTGSSTPSNVASATTDPAPIPVPDVPLNLAANAIDHQSISVTWDAVADADEYQVQRRKSGDTEWSDIGPTSSTEVTDTGLDPETTYEYRVRAMNQGGESEWAGPVSATTDPSTASGEIEFQSATSNWVDDEDTIEINRPENVAVGDLLIAQLTFEEGHDIELVVPEGWVEVERENRASDLGQAIFYKYVTSADLSTSHYTWGFLDDGDNEDLMAAGAILHYTGVATENPIVDSSSNGGKSNDPLALSVNAVDGSMLVGFFGTDDVHNNGLDVPENMTSRAYVEADDEVTLRTADQSVGAGLTGNRQSGQNGNPEWIAQMVALRPAN